MLLAFAPQWLRESASLLRYTYSTLPVLYLLRVVQVEVSATGRSIIQSCPNVYVCDQTQQKPSALAVKYVEGVKD